MATNPRRIMIGAALVNVLMWIGAVFLESKYSLALVIATLIVTVIGATLTIWNSEKQKLSRLDAKWLRLTVSPATQTADNFSIS